MVHARRTSATREGSLSTLPDVGQACDGTNWKLFNSVCQLVSIPVFKNNLGEVAFKSVRPRCYKTDTGLNASWDSLDEGEEVNMDDDQLRASYAIGDFYAKSGQQGECAIPRSKSCVEDA